MSNNRFIVQLLFINVFSSIVQLLFINVFSPYEEKKIESSYYTADATPVNFSTKALLLLGFWSGYLAWLYS